MPKNNFVTASSLLIPDTERKRPAIVVPKKATRDKQATEPAQKKQLEVHKSLTDQNPHLQAVQ